MYWAVLEYENGHWGVWFPDLPGCVSAGDSEVEAVTGAREALALHAEGLAEDGETLPAASDVAAIRERDDWPGEGAMLVPVPLIRRIGRSVRVNLSVDAGVLEAIDEEASRRGLTRSAYMVAASLDGI